MPIQNIGEIARAKEAIAKIESGGKYSAVGVATSKGQRAYGKYQVMDFNIPSWTKEALGKSMTPQEFLSNPDAQEKVFEHKFGQYAQKYGGFENAAKVWFGGPGALKNPNAKDILGTSVSKYASQFSQTFNQNNQPLAMAGLPGLSEIQQGQGLPQKPQGNLMAFADALEQATAAAKQARNKSSLDIMAPYRGTVAASDFNTILGNLNQASDTFVNDTIKKPFADLQSTLSKEADKDNELLTPTEAQALGVPYGTRRSEAFGKTPNQAPEGQLTPKQTSTALQLANSLKAHPAYTDMSDIATGMQGVISGLSQQNGFGDITAINAFQRMVDPGATVREGDVALVQTAIALKDKILSEYPIERLQSGAKLPIATRNQLEKTAQDLYAARSKNYNDSVGNQYRNLAHASGIPFEYVGQDFQVDLPQTSTVTTTTSVADFDEQPDTWVDQFLSVFGLETK